LPNLSRVVTCGSVERLKPDRDNVACSWVCESTIGPAAGRAGPQLPLPLYCGATSPLSEASDLRWPHIISSGSDSKMPSRILVYQPTAGIAWLDSEARSEAWQDIGASRCSRGPRRTFRRTDAIRRTAGHFGQRVALVQGKMIRCPAWWKPAGVTGVCSWITDNAQRRVRCGVFGTSAICFFLVWLQYRMETAGGSSTFIESPNMLYEP